MKTCIFYVVKDEVSFLEYTLPVMSKLFDHVYVLDTGSMDDTIKISSEYGLVESLNFSGFFSQEYNENEVRNYAMDRACKIFNPDLLIMTDGDESWNPKTLELIDSTDWNKYDSLRLSTFTYHFNNIHSKNDLELRVNVPWFTDTRTGIEYKPPLNDQAKTILSDMTCFNYIMFDSHPRIFKNHIRFKTGQDIPKLHQIVYVPNGRQKWFAGAYHHHFKLVGKKLRIPYPDYNNKFRNDAYCKFNLSEDDFGFDYKEMITTLNKKDYISMYGSYKEYFKNSEYTL